MFSAAVKVKKEKVENEFSFNKYHSSSIKNLIGISSLLYEYNIHDMMPIGS